MNLQSQVSKECEVSRLLLTPMLLANSRTCLRHYYISQYSLKTYPAAAIHVHLNRSQEEGTLDIDIGRQMEPLCEVLIMDEFSEGHPHLPSSLLR